MATIETVTGPIDAGELGTTLIHEHLRTRDEAVHEQWPQAKASGGIPERESARATDHEAAVEAARAARRARGEDDRRPDRDVPRPRRRASCATSPSRPGFRSSPAPGSTPTTTCRPSSSRAIPTRSPSCSSPTSRQGIQGTEIKAAFIKCAADEPGRDRERREGPPGRRARQPAHRGADHGPLAPGERDRPATGRDLRARRASTRRRCRSPTPATPTTSTTSSGCSRRGVYVGLDRYGLEMYLPYEQRQATTLALLERGYADRLFLSADSCATIDWFPPAADRADARGRDGQGLGHPDRARARAPGAARGRG